MQFNISKFFRILTANLGIYPFTVREKQVVASLLPHPTMVMQGHPTIAVLISIETNGKFYEEVSQGQKVKNIAFKAKRRWSASKPRKIKIKLLEQSLKQRIEPPPLVVHDLDLNNGPTHLQERFSAIVRKYASMWDETLGEINVANNRIELVPWTDPIAQVLYHAGH